MLTNYNIDYFGYDLEQIYLDYAQEIFPELSENEQNTLQECVSNINVLKKDMQEIKNLLLKLSEN